MSTTSSSTTSSAVAIRTTTRRSDSGGRGTRSRCGIIDVPGIGEQSYSCVIRVKLIAGISATFDYSEERAGERASSIGEVPYYDPSSVTRSEGLKQEGKRW